MNKFIALIFFSCLLVAAVADRVRRDDDVIEMQWRDFYAESDEDGSGEDSSTSSAFRIIAGCLLGFVLNILR